MAISSRKVMIHRFGETPGVSMDVLAGGIANAFRIDVFPGRVHPMPVRGFDGRRDQHVASAFLDDLAVIAEGALAAGMRPVMLGVTGADLFVPRLNFVFGQADSARGVAVISVNRLRPEFYGAEPDLDLFRERVLKEAVHELGHVFGLPHCDNPYCIMRFSNEITDTDRKGPGFCQECQVKLAARGLGRGV